MSAGGWWGQGRWGDCNEYTVSSEVMKMSNENTAAQSQNTLKAPEAHKGCFERSPSRHVRPPGCRDPGPGQPADLDHTGRCLHSPPLWRVVTRPGAVCSP